MKNRVAQIITVLSEFDSIWIGTQDPGVLLLTYIWENWLCVEKISKQILKNFKIIIIEVDGWVSMLV